MKFKVTKDGKELSKSLYTWDDATKTLSTNEGGLVLDFSGWDGVTFKTGSNCTFKTEYGGTFNTGPNCTFKTGSSCTFKTWSYCTFNTGSGCTFDTWYDCTFNTGSNCTFDTGSGCTFDTGSGCTFKAGYSCTFDAWPRCVIVRRDVFEVIQLMEDENHIRLNGPGVKGHEVLKNHTIIVDGEEVELSEDGYSAVKELLK